MKTCSLLAAVALASVFASGCQTDDYARQIVSRDTSPGRTLENIDAVMGASDQAMVAQGRINVDRQIAVADKVTIDVWVIKARNAANQPVTAKGTMLILHNLCNSRAAFPYRGVGERLAKMGYDVVLPDLRKHGKSTGDFITYGAKESPDLKTVMDVLIAENGLSPKVYAFGADVGGDVAIQYAAIDSRCKGVMAADSYQDMRGFVKHWYGRLLTPENFESVIAAAGRIADFDPNAASAVEAVKKVHCPLVLLHGVVDMSAPLDQIKAIYDAAGDPKYLWSLNVTEQLMLPTSMEDWVAANMDKLARSGVKEFQADAKPAGI